MEKCLPAQKFYVCFKEVRHANANAGDELRLVPSSKHPTEFKITAGYGFSSNLRTYQYAFFGTASYNESYDGMMVHGQYFRLYPVYGGEKFNGCRLISKKHLISVSG